MSRSIVLLALTAVFTAAAGAAVGEVGDLKYVSTPSSGGGQAGNGYQFGKVPANCGTVNPKATMTTLRGMGKLTIKAAIDSRKADAKAPDVVRLNLDGKDEFDDKLVVPLKVQNAGGDYVQYTIGPAVLEVKRGDRVIPINVSGDYYHQKTKGGFRSLSLRLSVAMEGRCRFGDKIYWVKLTDGNSNLSATDPTTLKLVGNRVKSGRNSPGGNSDKIRVTKTKTGSAVAEAMIGQPVLIEGKWYDLEIPPGAMKISARPADIQGGTIQIDHDNWSALFVGTKHVLNISGDRQAIEIPADTYAIANFTQIIASKGGPTARLACGSTVLYGGKTNTHRVGVGKTAKLAYGSPLEATTSVKVSRRSVRLNLVLKDAAGNEISSIYTPQGRTLRRPKAPKVTILDSTGNKIYTCTLEYG